MVLHNSPSPAAVGTETDKPREIFGLANHGSMCWFNSLIQVILSLPNLISTVRRCEAAGPGVYPVMAELNKFLAAVGSAPCMSAMPILTELMRACPGFGGRQEDSAEGMILMLDKLHPDVSQLFEATYRIDIYCDTCRATIGAPVQETMLSIPMERDFVTVGTSGDPFEQYLSGHMVRVTGWKCPKCGNEASQERPVMRIARLAKPPEILVVSLNKYSGKWAGPAHSQDIEVSALDGRASYILTGIIRHFGGPESGHYNALCRRPSGIWLFDDAIASPAAFRHEDVDYMLIYSRSLGRG